jgi:SpoVK/Ycf46/Vps4 family AAA+-type ATPase
VVADLVPAVYEWEDLVLPPQTLRRLADLAAAIRHRHQVFDAWAFGRLHGGHASVRAIFSGPSGTGKTMAASVLALDLGLELYRVDLSTVVSKYVGETEKNLERVLAAAEHSNALLLFDEAEALFGKRSEVRDAHDRYANIEIAFLLQRIESYEGVLLLSTNLAGNLDDAFHRRIHFHVEFPVPDEAARRRLWERAIPDSAPIDEDVDPSFLAGMFPMTGGEIRSATLAAAFMAADEGAPIGMSHLMRALARQRRQQGKLPSSSEFQGFLRLVQKEGS